VIRQLLEDRRVVLFEIGCLLLLYTSGVFVRLAPIREWGLYVTADDPVLHVRLTEYLYSNGHLPRDDQLAWYPWGQNWEKKLPNFRYYLTSGLYYIFQGLGMGLSIYDFCVLFPAFFAPLAVFPMFLLGRSLWDWKAGLVSAGVLVVSAGYLTRTIAGFYRHEHVGIPLLVLCMYLFVEALKAGDLRKNITYSALSGFVLVLLTGTWSGFRFLLDGYAVYVLLMMVLRRMDMRMLRTFIIVDGMALASTFFWPNLSTNFYLRTEFAIPVAIIATALIYQFLLRDRVDPRRLPVASIGISLILFLAMIGTVSRLPRGRYEMIVNPFREAPAGDVSQTVAEHADMRLTFTNGRLRWPALSSYGMFLFLVPIGLILPFIRTKAEDNANREILSMLVFLTFLLFLALDPYPALVCFVFVWLGLAGLWFMTPEDHRPNNSEVMVMVFAILAAYFFKNMIRLNILFSVFVAIQSGLFFTYVTRLIGSLEATGDRKPSTSSSRRRKSRRKSKPKEKGPTEKRFGAGPEIAIALIITLLLVWSISGSYKSAKGYPLGLREDWFDSLAWIEENSEEGDVIMSWWDYGYWIQTYAGRTTIADGATTNSSQIRELAKAFITTESAARDFCKEFDVRYVMIDVSDDFIGGKWTAMAVIAKQEVGDYMAVNEEGQTVILDKGERCPLFRMASRGTLNRDLDPVPGFEYRASFTGDRGGRVIVYEFVG